MERLNVTVRHTRGRTEARSIGVTRIVNCGLAGRSIPDERVLAEYEDK